MTVDSTSRTLLVAALVALGCSAMVATSVTLLRPLQQGHAQLDRQRNILAAAGLLPPETLDERQILSRYRALEARVVDLDSGNVVTVEDPHGFDHWRAAEDGAAARAPVYLLRRDGGRLERIVFPVHGQGMWSTIRAYVGIDPDLSTVRDLVIHEHGETPGIGDRIENPAWLAEWRGKRLYDDSGTLRLRVVKNATGEHQVDAITGASVTSDAVGEMLRNWFGDGGWGPFIARLKTQGVP